MVSRASFLPNNHPKVYGRMENQWNSMKITCHVPHPFLILNYQTGEFLKVIEVAKRLNQKMYMVQWSNGLCLSIYQNLPGAELWK